MATVKIANLHCQRCGWGWTPRQADVRICPHCKSASWDKPRQPAVAPVAGISSDTGAAAGEEQGR